MAVPNGASNVGVTYDAENRVIWVGPPNTSGSISTGTMPPGSAVQKTTVGGNATRYVFDAGGEVVAETDANGNWQVGYVYLNGQLEATYKDGTTYFVHGSSRLHAFVDRT